MNQQDNLLAKILSGASDTDIPFAQLWQLLCKLGFDEQIRAGNYIFTKEGVEEILNLQPKKGKVKSYQVKQIRAILLKYKIEGKENVSL